MSELNNKIKPADQHQRDIIVNDINKNIFVEAGAGSGKTRSLVERMVMMVRKGIKVSEISAITFTKAAAVEFYNRFENMLSEAINDTTIDKDERKNCEEALLNIDLCFMGTIDAFCNMILSENPIEAQIPLNSTIVEEEEYKFLIASEYNNIINSVKTQEEKDALNNFIRFQYSPKEVFTETMNKLLGKRNYKTDTRKVSEIQKREQLFYDTYKEEIKKLVAGIMVDDCKYIDLNNADSVKAKEFLLNNSWQLEGDWYDYPSNVINVLKKGLTKLHLTKDIPSITSNFYEYFELAPSGKFYKIKDSENEKSRLYEIIKEYKSIQSEYTLTFICGCVEKVADKLISQGKLSFFDNLLLFRNLLKNDAKNGGELIKHINKRHKYYLVDEFQDTDPLQAEIVFYLTAIKPEEDFTKCKPAPGTLFIVGDPKQSIYRFRNADVVSYKKIKELFDKNGDEFVELTTNFRSQKKLIDYFNEQFKLTFSDKDNDEQATFSKVDYYPDNKDNSKLEGVYLYDSPKGEDEKQVSNLITNLIKKGYQYADIMVLTNTRQPLEDYMDKFNEYSIPYEIVGKSIFDQCEPFINVRYLLGAIANPDNSYYVYKALKKVLKISDSNIYTIFGKKGPNLLSSVKHAKIEALINFYNNYKDENIIVIFDKLLDEFNILNISNVRNLEYLYYAKELLRAKIESGSVITVKEAYNFLNDLTDKKITERCLSLSNLPKNDKEQENRVLLANVHKVKGLERKIVILTSNYKNKLSSSADSVEIHSSFNEQRNYVIRIAKPSDPKNHSKINYIESSDFEDKKNSEAVALSYERDRIAYVAATRAIDALFISSNSINKDKKEDKTPWGSIIKDDSIKHLIQQDDTLFNDPEIKPLNDIKSSNLKVDPIVFNSSLFDNTYEIKSPSKLVHADEDKDVIVSKSIDNDATLKGTIVHRLLELFVSNKFKDSIDTYLSIINNEFLLESKYDELLKNVYNTMNNGGFNQDSGKVIDLISELKGAEEIITEVPFAYKDGNDIYNGIIDLLYKKENKWIIVDYKTNLDDKELDKKYENQLDGYKKALSSQGIEAEAYIYHIDLK